jgi:nitrite reductase/ring-hydroxylating ferredoxin subunit
MNNPLSQREKVQRGAKDAGRYFRYMTEFVGFTSEDIQSIRQSGLIIEKHVPNIVSAFYENLLRYPPTRNLFLKNDGSIDQDYLQKRMHHLTNFWRRTASGVYDDDYARYVDYVGRAHTSHGADPNIYIAERYVIGQVGFIQHAITKALTEELHEYDPDLEHRAIRAWNMLMMVILEMLSRAYGNEKDMDSYDPNLPVDHAALKQLAVDTYELGLGLGRPKPTTEVFVAQALEIPDGERKIVQVGNLSIGIFHHKGEWLAVHNHCMHRGGPVATGCLEEDVLICPWHGFRYNLFNGQLLVDPSVKLDMYTVTIRNGDIHLQVPVPDAQASPPVADLHEAQEIASPPNSQVLAENQFHVSQIAPGKTGLVQVNGIKVAVFNVNGIFYATQDSCTHAGAPLNEGDLEEQNIICPWHASCFNISNGEVTCGPATVPLQTFSVSLEGDIGSVN